jgi:hypothetical protein
MFYRIRSAQVPSRISGKSGHGHFFSEMSQIQKSAKKKKNAKNAKSVPKHSEILGVLSKIGCGDCRSIEKVSKMTPKIDALVHAHSKFRGTFSGFSGQLRIEVKFRKRATFWKNFHFCVLPAGGRRFFTWGENLNFAFFEKCGTRFRFWVRFCAASRENPSGRK